MAAKCGWLEPSASRESPATSPATSMGRAAAAPSVMVEPRVDDGPGGDRARRCGERTPFGVDLAGLLLGGFDVTVRVRDLRVGGVAHGVPINSGAGLHCVADHRPAHVPCPAEALQFAEIRRVLERE